MPKEPHPTPSFSTARKWGIGVNVCLIVLLVLAVVVMTNYISRDYFLRFRVSTRTKIELHPRTLSLLRSLTNQVRITLYYDKQEPLFSTVADMLNEYRLARPKCISVQVMDYLRDPGAAQKIKADYKLGSASEKNLIIFDCEGKTHIVSDKDLQQYGGLERIPGDKEGRLRTKLTAFLGESTFTAALLKVTNPKPLTAYFLQGHYEHPIDSGDEQMGYLKFASVLKQNYIQVQPLSLTGTNPVPQDCNLLIIAGPRTPIPASELERIEQYVSQGGRLFLLFNFGSVNKETGLEKLVAKWGVQVGNDVVVDPEHSESESRSDVIVSAFSMHPLVNPLLGSGIYLVRPRPVSKLNVRPQSADAPRVEVLATSGERAHLLGDESHKRSFPLMAAVEKDIKGVITERGATRIVVVGDSIFLANRQLDLLENRFFGEHAVGWLLDRTQLIEGLGPRPVDEYVLVMSKTQLETTQWLLLAGMPCGVLVLGGLVWLRRRR